MDAQRAKIQKMKGDVAMNNCIRNAVFESTEVKSRVQAIEYLENFLDSNDLSEEDQIRVYEEIATLCFKEDMYLEAMNITEKALEINRNNPRLNYFAARISVQTGDYMMTDFYLKASKSLEPKSVKARYFFAKDAMWRKHYMEAADEYIELLKLRPELHFLKKMAGVCLFEAENYGDAAFYLQQYVKEFPDDPDANFYLGASLKEIGDIDNAIKHLNIVIGNYHDVSNALSHLVELYLDRWEFDTAEKLVNLALERNPSKEEFMKLREQVKERRDVVRTENNEFVKIIEKVNGL